MTGKDWIDVVSFLASIASLVLAIVAIYLSIVFYKMSVTESRETTKAAADISSNVMRLDKLFDTLYTDIFSMMRDTVSDMRQKLWHSELHPDNSAIELERSIDQEHKNLVAGLEEQVNRLLANQSLPEPARQTLSSSIKGLVDNAITKTRELDSELTEEAVKRAVINVIARASSDVSVENILDRMRGAFPSPKIVDGINELLKESKITLSTEKLLPESIVRLSGATQSKASGR